MRIVYLVHQFFPRHVGGTEVYARGLAEHAVAAGHQVSIITYCENPSSCPGAHGVATVGPGGLPVYEVHANLSVAPNPALAEYDFGAVGRQVEAELARWHPDVVHAVHAMKLSGAALEACHRAGVPVILTLADYWLVCPRHTLLDHRGVLCRGPRHPFSCVSCLRDLHGFVRPSLRSPGSLPRQLWAVAHRNLSLRRRALRARRILALSGFLRRVFIENGWPAAHLEVWPHGLEVGGLDAARRARRRAGVLGFIGSVAPHKGVHLLLEAVARVPDPALRLVVWGAVEGGNAYHAQIRALAEWDPRVRLAGTFPPERMGDLLREIDVLVVPSLWYENEPLVVKAALYAGVPVVASRIGSLEDQVRDGVDGRLVPPGDPGALAATITELAQALPPFASSPERVRTIDQDAAATLSIYREVIAA